MIGSLPALDGLSFFGRTSAAGSPAPAQTPAETGFASLVSDMASDAAGNLHKAESLSVAALQGKAETREVVDAVMTAEQSLQAAIAIRDKIVQSYLEISRMAI